MAEPKERHIATTIPSELHRRMSVAAAHKGQTIKRWLTEAIAAECDRQESERERRR